MFVVVVAPDAGNFWSMSTENSTSHKQWQLYLRQQEGDKVGDKWETSGKTQKPVVEHDFISIQQKDTKAVKNRDKYETEHE